MDSDNKIQIISREAYEEFTSSNVCSVFQKMSWIDCTTSSKKYSKLYLGCFKANRMIGANVFVVRGFYPFYMVGSPMKGLYTEIGGPVFVEDITTKDVQTFVHMLITFIKTKYKPVFFQFTPDKFSFCYEGIVSNIKACTKLQEKIGRSALIAPSESSEIAWSRLVGRARTAIRKARGSNIIVSYVDASDADILNVFYDLYRGTFDRRGLKPRHSYAFFENILNSMDPNLIKLAVAMHEKKAVSAAIFLQDRDRVIYLAGVSSGDGLKLSAQSLVLWDCIEYCSQNNLKFDIGGLGDAGIDKFKKSFGGEIYEKLNYIHVNKIIFWMVYKFFKITL